MWISTLGEGRTAGSTALQDGLSSLLGPTHDVTVYSFLIIFPGPAYDLSFSEVRGNSLVVLWKAPVYTGASAVTGYQVDMAKKGSEEFVTLNQEAVSQRYLQVEADRK